MLGGALVPGKPVANMYFDMYGYGSVVQALALLSDLKLVCSYRVQVGMCSLTALTGTIHQAPTESYVHGSNDRSGHCEFWLLQVITHQLTYE